ncbi:cellulose binding domain-containing protein [Cellulomonas sp. SLBN-39]|uniref:cellulose binding domain-containing protein n=1 Tax=Cellulomonas sp. SLBN-39 TaxID=2768446 RepID=UPI0011548D26|nr:cellulose binding domain-containing protein [Cellulomonas sp. SLBN-39]TQL01286.1 cellulose binding domain-containing protein [Cellulomonas sp. SLBN-39]
MPSPTPATHRPRRARTARLAAGAAAVALLAGALVASPAGPAQAAGCTATYTVAASWGSGFTGNLAFTVDAPVDGWEVSWDFAAGEYLLQGWHADTTTTGTTVTARNPAWKRTLARGETWTVGFNATHTGRTPVPSAVRVNGVACTLPGASSPTATPTASATPTPSATPTRTATPTPTPTPTRTATPTPTPTRTAAPTPTPTPTRTPTPTPTPSATPAPAVWNPPASLAPALAEVWAHQEQTYNNGNLYAFRNYGWDQVIANGGYLNVCVRWDSTKPVSAALRDKIERVYAEQYQAWFDHLLNADGSTWNSWPYREVDVKVVGWAVRDRSLLQWDDAAMPVYVGDIREDAPQCPEDLGRFFHQDGRYPGGEELHYDQSLWLTDGFGGGAGGDWGQRMGTEYFLGAIDSPSITILQHEMGHTFGLDDFYDWTPTGVSKFVMRAGSSASITEFDGWMLRDWWRHLKPRYGL